MAFSVFLLYIYIYCWIVLIACTNNNMEIVGKYQIYLSKLKNYKKKQQEQIQLHCSLFSKNQVFTFIKRHPRSFINVIRPNCHIPLALFYSELNPLNVWQSITKHAGWTIVRSLSNLLFKNICVKSINIYVTINQRGCLGNKMFKYASLNGLAYMIRNL